MSASPLPKKILRPSLDLLREEYVLVQAWKKTAAYIRRHNWFSDTLELDLAAVDVRGFLDGIKADLESPDQWRSHPLRLVLAPKGQDWWVPKKCGREEEPRWQPRAECPKSPPKDVTKNLRPLAHVDLRDQVVATALMLCLADRVETMQGDPRPPKREDESPGLASTQKRFPYMSYGNRLFCDKVNGGLRHRWGSMKLYRGFYQDYRQFLAQPRRHAEETASLREVAVKLNPEGIDHGAGSRTFIVAADIKRFYDQVTPEALQGAIEALQRHEDDPAFFELAKRVLCWEWSDDDRSEVERYASESGIRGLDRVALPQGLVSAGFWSNVALLRFDEALQTNSTHPSGLDLVYGCRYVDDFRLVVTATGNEVDDLTSEKAESDGAKAVAGTVEKWLKTLLKDHACGLELNAEAPKRPVAQEVGVDQPGTVLQSQRLNRIQNRVSVGFSASEGLELLEAVQGLLMIRGGFTRDSDKSRWEHAPKPDVPEETRARFGAYRYRKVVRDVRAMLPNDDEGAAALRALGRPGTSIVTRTELDEMTRAFALVLVEKWVNDPSNVRILLTALDLWPDEKILKSVLELLRPWTRSDNGLPDAQRVAWYCLSEVFRAGATETGLFGDPESRPESLSLGDYRRVLVTEAWKVIRQTEPALPWYLRQQAFLLLFASRSYSSQLAETCRKDDPEHYRQTAWLLAARANRATPDEFARHAIVLHRCFDKQIPGARWTKPRMRALAPRDPAFAAELLAKRDGPLEGDWRRLAKQLLVEPRTLAPDSLARLAMEAKIERDEPTLLRLALVLLDALDKQDKQQRNGPVPPWRVHLREGDRVEESVRATDFPWKSAQIADPDSLDDLDLWSPPQFCAKADHWRYQLAYLLRFVLARSPDFTANASRSRTSAAPGYRSTVSYWAQRKYGGNHSQGAFGGDWLPISDWFERFLSALLWWPGRRTDAHTQEIDKGIEATRAWLKKRRKRLEEAAGKATGATFLPMAFTSEYLPEGLKRLRGCVVQTTWPVEDDFDGDLTLSSPPSRSLHRNYLTDALALVRQGLRANRRDSAEGAQETPALDLLILPELAVHPEDVRRYLVPFARAFKTIVLAGVVFEELPPETTRLVNTAVWVIPEYGEANGWNVRIRRQGKKHLARLERGKRHQGLQLTDYRPCQWIVECPSSLAIEEVEPLRLSAAVCYDATDLALTADLRERSDVFLIPALNKDVQTFDNLALALSYQMYQLVVVANSGRYGGSSAYWPIGDAHERRLLHLHGQNQMTLGYFEIPDVVEYRRSRAEDLPPRYTWKAPPAGYDKNHR